MGGIIQKNDDVLDDTSVVIDITKDIPSAKKISTHVNEQTNNSSVLAEVMEMARSRRVKNHDGIVVTIPDHMATENQIELLFYLTHTIKPILSSETGFAYGLTASAFLCAHALNNLKGGHVPIHNNALEVNSGVGHHTLKRLRFENYQIMEHEPSIVLPEIFLQQLAPDLRLSYINGFDEYDEAMLEFYYYDRQTLGNGIIAVNTHQSNGRKDLLNFIKKYRPSYTVANTECGITLIQRNTVAGQHPLTSKSA